MFFSIYCNYLLTLFGGLKVYAYIYKVIQKQNIMTNLTDIQIENRAFLGLSYYFTAKDLGCKTVTENFVAEIAEKLNAEFNCFNSVNNVAKLFKVSFKNALLNYHFIDSKFQEEFYEELGFYIEKTQIDNYLYLKN